MRSRSHRGFASSTTIASLHRARLDAAGTDDWAALPDRMHYFADLFRLHLENARLFEQPFSRGQLRSIANDHVPDGPL